MPNRKKWAGDIVAPRVATVEFPPAEQLATLHVRVGSTRKILFRHVCAMAGTRPNKMIRRLMDGMIDAVLEKVPEYPDLVFDQRVKELLRVHEEAIRRGYMKKGGH